MRVCLKYMDLQMTLDAQAGQTPQEPYNDVHGKQLAFLCWHPSQLQMQLRRVHGGEKPDEQDEGDELFRVISQRGHGHPHVCMCGRHARHTTQRLQPPARARWADITLHRPVVQPADP